MTDISQLLQQIGSKASYFSLSSRYKDISTATMQNNKGESLVFLKRRFVPKAENFVLLEEHTVNEGERLDNITNHYLGDPERFWQICDANDVLNPDALTETAGSKIRITLPQGIPG
jgi:hypothetical protein